MPAPSSCEKLRRGLLSWVEGGQRHWSATVLSEAQLTGQVPCLSVSSGFAALTSSLTQRASCAAALDSATGAPSRISDVSRWQTAARASGASSAARYRALCSATGRSVAHSRALEDAPVKCSALHVTGSSGPLKRCISGLDHRVTRCAGNHPHCPPSQGKASPPFTVASASDEETARARSPWAAKT